MLSLRERWLLGATLVVATGLPLAARAAVRTRTQHLAARLTEAGGVPAHVGSIDADLTGAIRLTDLRFGDLVQVDAIEAAVAMGSLLHGDLRADEIVVSGPHLAVAVDATGDSDLARLARRLAKHGTGGSHSGRLRRIVVDGGALGVHVDGVGDLTAEDLELVPDATGVRIIAGRVHVKGRVGAKAELELAFARGAADLALPQMTFSRALGVGGTGALTIAGTTAHLSDLSAGRLPGAGDLELRGAVDDDGIPRPFAARLDHAGGWGITLEADRVPLRVAASLAPHGLDLTAARATGTLVFRSPTAAPTALPGTTFGADFSGTITGLAIDHPTVAATPVTLDVTTHSVVRVDPDAIVVPAADLTVGKIQVTAHGWVLRHDGLAAQLDVSLQPTTCAGLFTSIPAQIRGPLDGIGFDGTAGAHAKLVIDLGAPDGAGVQLTGAIDGACRVTTEPPGADVAALTQPGEMTLGDGTRRRMDPTEETYTSLANVSDIVYGAFVSAEDGRFWQHDGFDLEQIARSFEIDLREHRLARGGSTISQQLVKNAFLSQRRTLDRKLQEAVLTWRLEARLGKRQILERYLNLIELGPHVYGLHDAAHYWFDRQPANLTARQVAFLAALTSQPTAMARRIRKAGGLDAETADRIGVVLRAMRRDGVIDNDEYGVAKDDPLGLTSIATGVE